MSEMDESLSNDELSTIRLAAHALDGYGAEYGDRSELVAALRAITARHDALRLGLDSVCDPTFCGGLPPVEYLTRLHEGTLGDRDEHGNFEVHPNA